MKLVLLGAVFFVIATGCASNYDVKGRSFDSVLLTVSTDGTMVSPPNYNTGNFVKSIKDNILELTTTNIKEKGNLKIAQTCAPGVLHVDSKIRSVLVKDVYEVKRGTHTIEKSAYDAFSIDTTGVFIDCATGTNVGSFEHSEEGSKLFSNLQEISEDTAIDIYQYVVFGG